VSALRWQVGHGVQAAWSTRADGDQREPGPRSVWLAGLGLGGRRCAVPRQVHGIRIAVDPADPAEMALCDGIVSRDPRVVLGAYGADCPGLVLAAPDAFGVAHGGWRGTAAGIVPALVRALAGISAHPTSAWCGLVGPGIGADRYEVDAPVLTARTWPAGTVLRPRDGRADLDLPGALAADAAAAGIPAVVRCGVCTASDPRLHSYRHRGGGLVQLLAVWRA
jgi:copper oxidase (laccase) domain-containing protein